MQPPLQQSQSIQHSLSTTPARPQLKRCYPAPVAGHAHRKSPAPSLDLARHLIALLPGRAALLDASGLVIAWNQPALPTSGYKSPPQPDRSGLLVTPLLDAGGTTLIWAPETASRAAGNEPDTLAASHAKICDLTCRLMNAQEEERKKIARELHDDLGQRLAAHALAIGNLKQHLPHQPGSLKERLLALQDEAIELGEAIRMVSHELHPALLERLELSDALRTFSAEFCEWSGLRLVANIQRPVEKLSEPVAIATYRIAQEALRNIEKHAHATTVHLKLRFTPHQLLLIIADNGVGFSPDDTAKTVGLGLTSIGERVRLLNGQLSLDGKTGHGTTLTVRLPKPYRGP